MKQRKRDRSFIVILIFMAIVVLIMAISFFRQYLSETPEPSHTVNSFVVPATSETPPLLRMTEPVVENTEPVTTETEELDIQTEPIEVGRGLETGALLERIIAAINQNDDYERIFRDIPQSQRNDLALEEFAQYINLLNRAIGGRVDAYSTMSLEYVRSIENEMTTHGEEASNIVSMSTFHWLEHNNGDETQRFPILLQQDSSGTPFLSRNYIRACLDLYSFTRLYYQVVDQGDVAALTELIYSDSRDGAYTRAKAEETIRFYNEEVRGGFDDFKLISVRSDALILEQSLAESTELMPTPWPEPQLSRQSSTAPFNPSPETAQTRRVTVVKQDRGYLVYDAIPDAELMQPRIFKSHNLLLHLGDYFTFDEVWRYLDEPEYVEAWTLDEPVNDMTTLVQATWADKQVKLLSSDFDPLTLEGGGRLVDIQNRDQNFSLGEDIQLGMKVDTLLSRFHFLNVQGYKWTDTVGAKYRVFFDPQTETVGEITQSASVMDLVRWKEENQIPVNGLSEARIERARRTEEAQSNRSIWDRLGIPGMKAILEGADMPNESHDSTEDETEPSTETWYDVETTKTNPTNEE